MQDEVDIPNIITANTYFWSSGGSASARRYNEKRHNATIEEFANYVSVIPTIKVSGDYSETCKNVYKTMSYEVLRKGEFISTNLTGLIGECARWGLTLVK